MKIEKRVPLKRYTAKHLFTKYQQTQLIKLIYEYTKSIRKLYKFNKLFVIGVQFSTFFFCQTFFNA